MSLKIVFYNAANINKDLQKKEYMMDKIKKSNPPMDG
jgi:hypothetical protein